MSKESIDVLVIDDDADLCMLMKTMLKFADYRVEMLTNPIFLKERLSKFEPRMLLMDMLLSGSDGRDICRALRAHELHRNLTIMMISAHPDAEKTCKDAGADDFLGKPFDMDVFLGKIANLLSRTDSSKV